jgi:hypothetical protein
MSLLRTSYRASLSLAGCCAFLFLASSAACGVGGVDGGGGMTGDGPVRIPADDPSIDDRLDALEIICESTLNVTGTFVESLAQPEGYMGCWPVGTWSVTATVDRLGCDPQPEVTENFVYEVTFDEEASTHNVAFTGNGMAPNDDRVNLKISTAGDSLCHGSMDHYAIDGTVWGFRPTLQLDGTLLGIGTYSVFEEDSF